ncbi:hypothetical protein BCR35DRAFT_333738 [Leucosporidium creatinivorum]|uniref:F-box domain-containing protein n=1 Tax=Leucosporidium creatinivorum TaxID=106004 RepID=A0A1Y2ENV2_9BASI|nr:hypothetical protein BCR35DRAFT_333738 [Leucosporidium creatinivorum]
MPELPDEVLQIILKMIPSAIKYDYKQQFNERKKVTIHTVGLACCLVSRRFLPFGRKLLYRRVCTSSASTEDVYNDWIESDRRPGPIVEGLLEKPHLGAVVEEWVHVERDYPGDESAVLKIEDLERCLEGGTKPPEVFAPHEAPSSALDILRPPFASELEQIHLDLRPLSPRVVVPLKLNEPLQRATSLASFTLGGVEIVSSPAASLASPTSLRSLVIYDGHLNSLLPLIEATPLLTKLKIYIGHDFEPTLESQGVRPLSKLHLGLEKLSYKHRVHDMFSDAPFQWFDPSFIDSIQGFISSFPNLVELDFGAGGFGKSIDLHKLPRRLEKLTILENGGVLDPAAGPTLQDLKEWLQKGGGPKLKVLRLRDRSSVWKEQTEGVRKACKDRGVELKLKSLLESFEV